MDTFMTVVLLGLAGAGVWWWLRGTSTSREAETRLRRICFGDESQVDQLIASEMTRAPGITRAEAAHRAVLRYERDNR
jgi:hypothetical protein